MEHDTPIGKMLSFDGLYEAEKITGKSYKEDERTSAIGFGLAMRNNAEKAEVLKATDDSYYGILFADMVDLMRTLGFEKVLHDTFDGRDSIRENYVIMWHPDGLLAKLESYNTTGLNSASVHYEIKFDEDMPDNRWEVTSSGGPMSSAGVYPGSHDAREGVRFNLDRLRRNGKFQPKWTTHNHFLWLLNYMDSKVEGYDYAKITAERFSRLPQHVQDAIGEQR